MPQAAATHPNEVPLASVVRDVATLPGSYSGIQRAAAVHGINRRRSSWSAARVSEPGDTRGRITRSAARADATTSGRLA